VVGLTPVSGTKLYPQSLVTLSAAAKEAVLRIGMTMTATEISAGEPEALVRDLICLLSAEHGDPNLARTSRFTGPAMDARVMRATRYMRENAMVNPGLEEVAKQVGLSRSRFFEQFKNCLGVSPQQYLDWQRMALATRLLSESGATVADVSDRLGFSAPSHFTRFFSQHIGFPPSDFRRGILTAPGPDAG
jgi:AraC-like DNA-binding protein